MGSTLVVTYLLISIKKHVLGKHVSLRPFRPQRLAILYIAEGEGTIRLHGRTRAYRAGSCFLLTPSARTAVRLASEQAVTLYWLHYEGLLIDLSDPKRSALQTGLSVSGDEDAAFHASRDDIVSLLEDLLRADRQARGGMGRDIRHGSAYADWREAEYGSLRDPAQNAGRENGRGAGYRGTELERNRRFQDLLCALTEEIERRAPDHSNGNEAIRQTVEYLQRSYMHPIDVGMLPQLAGLTPSSFCRAFKRSTGMTPSGYLSSLRVEKAKELLTSPCSGRTLKQVARSVGFQDELYFSRVFKKNEGVSPSLYRKESRQGIAVVTNLFLQDHLLSLGVTPLAAPAFPSSYSGGYPSYLRDGLKHTIALNAERKIHYRDVAGLKPDIIIKMGFRNNPNDAGWSRAANTVYVDWFPNWNGYLLKIAAMVGKEEATERIIGRIGQAEAAGRDALSRFTREGRWAVIRVMPDDFRLYTGASHSMTDLLFRGLGFQPCRLAPGFSYRQNALMELAALDPDRILVVWSKASALASLETNPVWRGLRAVAGGQVYVPNSVEWDAWGPIGREWTIRACVDYFSAFV